MASGGCSASLAASGTTKGKKQWKDCSFPLAKLVPLSILASLVICFGFQAFSTVRAVTAQTVTTDCVPGDNKTTCSCEEQGVKESGKQLSAILSKDRSVLTVDCKGVLKFAPKVAADNRVCSAQEDLPACTLSLHKLLAGNSPDVNWTECETNGKTKGECKSLSIPQERFPFIDQQFAVGCVNADDQNKCRVPVTLKARASVTEGQTVTCAYGAGSNESSQSVTLSPSQNSFTLVCGEKGAVLPKRYDETYCLSDSKAAAETCDGDYKAIVPGYESTWWKEDEKAKSFTLSIPTDKFPKEQAKIVVGCQQERTSEQPTKAEDAPSPTVCSVDVTIAATASALDVRMTGKLSLLWGAGAVALFAHAL